MMHLILVINIGSTSTKAGLFSHEDVLFKETTNGSDFTGTRLRKFQRDTNRDLTGLIWWSAAVG